MNCCQIVKQLLSQRDGKRKGNAYWMTSVLQLPDRRSGDDRHSCGLIGVWGPSSDSGFGRGARDFDPGASRSRTVVAVGSRRAASGRLVSPRPRVQSAKCRQMTADAAWVATYVATFDARECPRRVLANRKQPEQQPTKDGLTFFCPWRGS